MLLRPSACSLFAVLALLLMIVPSAALAEDDPPAAPSNRPVANLESGGSATEPHPVRRLLNLTIGFAAEPSVLIQVPERRLATYRSFDYGESFGILARLKGGDEVEVQLVSIAGERPAYRPVRVLDTLQGRVGFPLVGTTPGALPVTVEVEVVEVESGASTGEASAGGCPSPFSKVTGATVVEDLSESTDTCCVTCYGSEWCGCTVRTKCGNCTGC